MQPQARTHGRWPPKPFLKAKSWVPAAESKAERKSKAKAAEEEDIDALLAQLDGPKAAEPAPEAGTGGKKKKKKGKGGAAAKEEEDLDALLAEFGAPKAAEAAAGPSTGAAAGEPAANAEDAADADGDEADGDGDGDEKVSTATPSLLLHCLHCTAGGAFFGKTPEGGTIGSTT